MKKIYPYTALSDSAKVIAILQTMAYEEDGERDYEEDSVSLQELYVDKFKEIGVKISDITFNISDGDTPDYYDIEAEKEFFQKHLSEEEFSLYERLGKMVILENRFLDDSIETDGYELTYEEDQMGLPSIQSMRQFIYDYTKNEEMKLKLKLPLLVETTATEAQEVQLSMDFGGILRECVARITKKLDSVVLATNAEVEKLVQEKAETMNTVEFYKEAFQRAESHKGKRYRFSETGELITDYQEFVRSEFDGVYNECEETTVTI